MDASDKLLLVTLATGATRAALHHGSAYGVGSWSPDGSLLLAFVCSPLALVANLVAIDCKTGRYGSITSLDEWNFGEDCGLVKRRLLSRVSTP